uniref:[phosphatase 2A protein]-leucine-carboxy methyltransferase n=1 Tax=Rhodnius prolixus TaxID=13249 RepID=T1HP10_RHOPR
MISNGYYSDEYIKYFVQRYVKRAPLINVGYFVRAWIVHHSLTNFLKSANDMYAQIVSLGAGFDTSFFKFASDYNNTKYFEIDLPGVVKRKIEIIKNSEALIIFLGKVIIGNENEYLMSSKYCIFSHDLNFVDGLEVKMKKYGFEFNEITLLFSECAITYLEETKSTEFIRWSQTKFPKSIFLTFEQINPDDAFGQVMITHFNKIQSPLKSVQKHKTIQQQIQRW